mgnify:FL=1
MLNSWGKVVLFIGSAVVSCAFAYYMLLTHEREINLIKKEHKEAMDIIEERAEKRYSRAMEKANKLEDYGIQCESRLRELEKELSYLKGQHNGF